MHYSGCKNSPVAVFDCLNFLFNTDLIILFFRSVQWMVQSVIEHMIFRIITVILILLDLTLVIIDLAHLACNANSALEIVSHLIISYFVLEIFLRIFYMQYVLEFLFQNSFWSVHIAFLFLVYFLMMQEAYYVFLCCSYLFSIINVKLPDLKHI